MLVGEGEGSGRAQRSVVGVLWIGLAAFGNGGGDGSADASLIMLFGGKDDFAGDADSAKESPNLLAGMSGFSGVDSDGVFSGALGGAKGEKGGGGI